MSRNYAIILRSSSRIEEKELVRIRERFPGVRAFALKIEGARSGMESIPIPDIAVNSDPEMYFSDVVHSFLSTSRFEKVLFFGCPELAVTSLRVQLCHLDFSTTAFGLCPPRVKSIRESQRFLSVEAMSSCSSLRSTDAAGAIEFFSRRAPAINDDALFAPSPITVAIPTKDRWDLLKQTLETLEKQTFKDFRVLIGDDASEENGRESFDSWLAGRTGLSVEVVRNESTKGPGATRNRLAELAETPYVAFFDDDNLAMPKMMETWSKLTRLSSVDAFSCAYESFLEKPDGRITRGADSVFVGKIVGSSVAMNGFGDSASLFKRASFLKSGGFNEDPGALFEDFELFLRMHLLGYELRTIPHRLFRYRRHERQRTHTAEVERGLERLASTSKKWNLRLAVKKSYRPQLADYAAGWRGVDHLHGDL